MIFLLTLSDDRMSFFTRFIVNEISYLYGLVFAGCCAALVVIVFFFVIESKDRSLEEIDTMYVLGVNPITSAKWDGSKPASGVEHSDSEAGEVPVERVKSKTVE
jgi:SP family sugar:H+ symporter-like MFS transporter